ncbi:FRG domain-containing protein [Pontixanthobacter sp. CEM42]|uniref:FRG domain-containing protein n=1 Tax=Pontixanthobacter sp. CEM42 TaxID=2792077 RepID=UPI001ADF3206|nr:FRG domain-containing protein [Pontixanthobacter sp. CEM42]
MSASELQRTGFRVISKMFDKLSELPQHDLIFRGHGDKSWPLVPSVYRKGKVGIRNREQLREWIIAADRFVQPRPQSDVEWLVWAQHYGIATSFLDWTVSPLIALFFAAEDQSHRNGMVLSARRTAFNPWIYLSSVNVFGDARKRAGLVAASSINARALAQDSVMTLHTPFYERELPNSRVSSLFEVRSSEKKAVLAAMNTLGINRERVYSDITILVDRLLEHPIFRRN